MSRDGGDVRKGTHAVSDGQVIHIDLPSITLNTTSRIFILHLFVNVFCTPKYLAVPIGSALRLCDSFETTREHSEIIMTLETCNQIIYIDSEDNYDNF